MKWKRPRTFAALQTVHALRDRTHRCGDQTAVRLWNCGIAELRNCGLDWIGSDDQSDSSQAVRTAARRAGVSKVSIVGQDRTESDRETAARQQD